MPSFSVFIQLGIASEEIRPQYGEKLQPTTSKVHLILLRLKNTPYIYEFHSLSPEMSWTLAYPSTFSSFVGSSKQNGQLRLTLPGTVLEATHVI